MKGYNTPEDMQTDGCTLFGPRVLQRVLGWVIGASRAFYICKRHDFECRFDIFPWHNAAVYAAKGVWHINSPLLKWRAAIVYIGLVLSYKRCKYIEGAALPEAWWAFADRGYTPEREVN